MTTLLLSSAQTLIGSAFTQQKFSIDKPWVEHYRVLPTDLDTNLHMNNARYLNYMEAARWGFQAGSGFLKVAIQRRWIAPIAGLEIRYYRSLKLFERFEVTVQLVALEPKWNYIHQVVRQGSQIKAEALVKSVIKARGRTIAPEEYLQPLGISVEQIQIPEQIAAWLATFQR